VDEEARRSRPAGRRVVLYKLFIFISMEERGRVLTGCDG
jgi:hypothetical protein